MKNLLPHAILRCIIQFIQLILMEIYNTFALQIPKKMIQNVVGFLFVRIEQSQIIVYCHIRIMLIVEVPC